MKGQADTDYTREHDLTIAEVRACPSFAHLSDDQAREVVEAFKLFAKIAYDSHKNTPDSEDMSGKNRILKA